MIQSVIHERTGLLASTDEQLADHCIKLLRHPNSAWAMGVAGQHHVLSNYCPDLVCEAWLRHVEAISSCTVVLPPAVSTPWHHEQRWLRQLWGGLLMIPGWPSWPSMKAGLKHILQGGEQAISPKRVGVLAGLMALLVWAFVVLGKYGGNPTGLARIGDQIPLSPRLEGQELVVLQGKRGNDGQQFLTLALDPLQLEPGTSAAVDNPIYRGKRVLYPMLAWVLGLGQPGLILWILGLINVTCIGLAAAVVARWAQLEQRSSQWGLAVLALPAYWITLSLNTADLLATTLMLSAALAWKQRRLGAVWGSLCGALLTRETALLAWAATGLSALLERGWRCLLPLALVPVPLWVFTAVLRARFPEVADGALASLHFTWPMGGILSKTAQLLGLVSLPGVELGGAERVFDILCFGLWLSTLAALAVACWRGWGGGWLRWACGLYLLPALCTSMQILARFPDYTRVWIDLSGLALLALLSARVTAINCWLFTSGLVGTGYIAGYLLMAS